MLTPRKLNANDYNDYSGMEASDEHLITRQGNYHFIWTEDEMFIYHYSDRPEGWFTRATKAEYIDMCSNTPDRILHYIKQFNNSCV